VAILACDLKGASYRCCRCGACVASIYFLLLLGRGFCVFRSARERFGSRECVGAALFTRLRDSAVIPSLSLELESSFYLILNRGINRTALDALMAIQVDCFRILFQVRPCNGQPNNSGTFTLVNKCDSHVAIVGSEHTSTQPAIYLRIYRRANNGKNCLINAHASLCCADEKCMFRWRTAGELVCAAAAHADSFACKSSATSSLSLSLLAYIYEESICCWIFRFMD
jgi:hypothetical protein